jgi:threonine dehydrogenase-like Zn-dependent dehydrogenase
VGTQQTFEACTRVVRRGGTVSSVGVYGLTPGVSMPTFTPSFLHRTVVTTLCPVGSHRMTALLDLVRFGGVDLSPLFTHRMRLREVGAAYELFRSKQEGVLKIALRP